MSGPDTERDPRIADALASIRVPDYAPGFWERLDARLAEEGDRPGSADAAIPLVAAEPVDQDELVVVPLAGRRRVVSAGARRGIALLAVAAAAVVAVLAVQLSGDDAANVDVTQQPDVTTPTPVDHAGERVPAELGATGSTATPQDAFAAWVAALAAGDHAAARALLGPHTVAYYEALGNGIESAGDGYEIWSDLDGLSRSVIDLGEVAGEPVAAIVLHRPDPSAPSGTRYEAVPLVQTAAGWRVEPAAFDPDDESRLEPVRPGPGEHGLTDLAVGQAVQVQVQGDGVYYVGVDERTLSAFVPADAHDGLLTLALNPALAPGPHVLVLAHLSPTVLTVLVEPFEVTPSP